MQILQVIPITQSINSETLTYFSVKKVSLGQLVTVPLRKKEISAIVVSAESVINMKTQLRGASYQIRNILDIHNGHVFSPTFLTTSIAVKNFYASTTGRIIEKFVPSFILKKPEDYLFSIPKENNKTTTSQTYILQRPFVDRISYYKTLIREKSLQKKSIHIICPTVQWSIRLFKELEKNNKYCFVLHNELTKKKIREQHATITQLEKPSILISTPLFIDTYQYHKDTIIIEKEASDYYRSITAPYVDSRIFIHNYAKYNGSECVFADAIVRPETWYQKTDINTHVIEPCNKKVFRADSLRLIHQHNKNPRKQTDSERISELTHKKEFSLFSKETLDALKTSVKNKEKIFLYTPKKSLAPITVCNDCGNVAQSPTSGRPYALYIKTHPQTRVKERIFICNTTGESIPAFDTCQFCNSWNMKSLGIGTEKIQEEIQKIFPKVDSYIIDGTHTKTKKQLREVITEYESSKKAIIIIGTQKAIAYLETIDTSIIVSLDSFFSRLSYTIHTQILSLINEIVEKTKNSTLLQSRNITHESLPVLHNGLYIEYIEHELDERKRFNYPPYITMCTITRHIQKTHIKKEYKLLNELFSAYNPQILVHPGRTKAQVRLIIILELDTKIWNQEFQDQTLQAILSSFDRKTEIRFNPKDLV